MWKVIWCESKRLEKYFKSLVMLKWASAEFWQLKKLLERLWTCCISETLSLIHHTPTTTSRDLTIVPGSSIVHVPTSLWGSEWGTWALVGSTLSVVCHPPTACMPFSRRAVQGCLQGKPEELKVMQFTLNAWKYFSKNFFFCEPNACMSFSLTLTSYTQHRGSVITKETLRR